MNDASPQALGEEQIAQFIREAFDQNYERLRLEGGHPLAPDVKETAYQQVLRYWQKLREVAESVTDTEVKLTLPEQVTPRGRRYTIEGVVDIVRDDEQTVMYDIKSHDPEYVRGNIRLYEKQLNVYAHIWQNLRGEPLDLTAVIATAFPAALRDAIGRGDEALVEREMEKWDPLVEIPFNQDHIEETIREFGEAVDAIEGKEFAPPAAEALRARVGGSRVLFATHVCRNCDARFSCGSYREYATSSANKVESAFRRHYSDFGTEAERGERLTIILDQAPPPEG